MKRLPRGSISPATTRVLLALLWLHRHHQRPTVRAVADRAGMNVANCHQRLRRLQDEGLVAGLGVPGGLHATCRPVDR